MAHKNIRKRKKRRVKGVEAPRLRSAKYSLKHTVGKIFVKSGDELIAKGKIEKGLRRRRKGLAIGSPKTRREAFRERKGKIYTGDLGAHAGSMYPTTGAVVLHKNVANVLKDLKRERMVLKKDIRLAELGLTSPHLKKDERKKWEKFITKNRRALKKNITELKEVEGKLKDIVEHERAHRKDMILFGFQKRGNIKAEMESLVSGEISAYIQSRGRVNIKEVKEALNEELDGYRFVLPKSAFREIKTYALARLEEKMGIIDKMQKSGASVYEIRKMLLEKNT